MLHLLGGGLHVLQCLVAFCLRAVVGLRTKELDFRVISYFLLENDFRVQRVHPGPLQPSRHVSAKAILLLLSLHSLQEEVATV